MVMCWGGRREDGDVFRREDGNVLWREDGVVLRMALH